MAPLQMGTLATTTEAVEDLTAMHELSEKAELEALLELPQGTPGFHKRCAPHWRSSTFAMFVKG